MRAYHHVAIARLMPGRQAGAYLFTIRLAITGYDRSSVKFPTMQFSGLEIIHNCLALAPLPYLATVFSAFMFIWTSVEQAQASK